MGPKHKLFSAICSDQEYLWMCIGGTLSQNLFGDFQLSRILMNMHWWNLNTKSFRRFSAIKNTYWHALVGHEHKIFSTTFSYQKKLIDMHWRDFNTKSVRRFSAIKNTFWHAFVGIYHKMFSTIFSYQEYLLTCIGVTWTQSLFGDFPLSRILIDMHWWDMNTKSFRRLSATKKLIDMHWRDFNTKSVRRFSAIKNTFWHALVEIYHKIFSTTFNYQEYLLTCIGVTWTQNLFGDFQLSRKLMNLHWWNITQNPFGDFQLSRKLIDMHWWDLNTKSFRRFSVIKNTYWHALVLPEQKIVSTIFSFQEHLLRCIGGTLTQNLFGEFKLSKMYIDMHWWNFTKKSFRRFSAIKNT